MCVDCSSPLLFRVRCIATFVSGLSETQTDLAHHTSPHRLTIVAYCVVGNRVYRPFLHPSPPLSLTPPPLLSPSLDMSAQELVFGEYLGAYSEREYTNAGQVMKSTGRVLQLEAKARSALHYLAPTLSIR